MHSQRGDSRYKQSKNLGIKKSARNTNNRRLQFSMDKQGPGQVGGD